MTSRHAPASADGAPDAAALVRAADAARLADRFAEAEAGYRSALALAPGDEAITLELALCLSAQGKAREAAPLLARLVRTASGAPAIRERASRALADARHALGAVTVEAPRPGTSIEADGTAVGPAPLLEPLYLEPGAHTLRAVLDGHAPSVARLQIEAGRTYLVHLEPPPLPAHVVLPRADRRAGAEAHPIDATGGFFLGAPGIVRAASLTLTAAGVLGGIGAIVTAEANGAEAAREQPACAGASSPDARACVAVERAIASRAIAVSAATALFAGAAVAAGAAAISLLLAPPGAARSGQGGPSVALSTVASPSGGGLFLEASW